MITVKKLLSLRRDNRLAHIARLMVQAERDLVSGKCININYLREVLSLLCRDLPGDPFLREQIENVGVIHATVDRDNREEIRRCLNAIRHRLLIQIGKEPADWDFRLPSGELDPSKRKVFPIAIYLDDIRSPFNVGSIFRTAESFGVQDIFLSPGCASPTHPRAARSAMGCTKILPWKILTRDQLNTFSDVFALETGGTPLYEFSFPKQGIMIIGSEELGINPEAMEKASLSSGIVSIPTGGSKHSLNVSVACGIALYCWYNYLKSIDGGPSRSQAD